MARNEGVAPSSQAKGTKSTSFLTQGTKLVPLACEDGVARGYKIISASDCFEDRLTFGRQTASIFHRRGR